MKTISSFSFTKLFFLLLTILSFKETIAQINPPSMQLIPGCQWQLPSTNGQATSFRRGSTGWSDIANFHCDLPAYAGRQFQLLFDGTIFRAIDNTDRYSLSFYGIVNGIDTASIAPSNNPVPRGAYHLTHLANKIFTVPADGRVDIRLVVDGLNAYTGTVLSNPDFFEIYNGASLVLQLH